MKCPWCSGIINAASERCPSCAHEFNAGLRDRISTILRLEANLAYIMDIASRTRKSANALEMEIKALEGQAAEEAILLDGTGEGSWEPSPEQPVTQPPGITPPQETATAATNAPENVFEHFSRNTDTPPGRDIEESLGQKWLPIIGVITVIFGVGYFLKYAIDQGWVSPLQRVLAAYGWGAAFMLAGHFLRKRGYGGYGLIVMGGGLASCYFSTFAAYQLYGLISQRPAFVIMFMITLATGLISVYYSNMWLAVLGIFGGYFTPVMLSTGSNNYVFLFIYLGILGACVLGTAYYRRWPLLNYLGFIGTYLLYWLWYDRHFEFSPFWPAMASLAIYFIAYAFVPFAYRFFRAEEAGESVMTRGDVSLIMLNSFIAFGFSYSIISSRFSTEAVSVAALFYSASFFAMAWLIYTRVQGRPTAFGVFASNAGLFLAVAVALALSDFWISFFWAVQGAGLFWAAMRIRERGLLRTAGVLLMGLAYARFFYDYGELGFSMGRWIFTRGYMHEIASRALLAAGILGSLAAMAISHRRHSAPDESKEDRQLYMAIAWGFGFMLFFLLNAETGGFFHYYLPKARFAAISVLWTVFSAALMILGFRRQAPMLRKLSIGLFFATLLKVFFADISKIDTPYRILSFIVLGTVLVSVSYLYHRFHDRLSQALGAQAEDDPKGGT